MEQKINNHPDGIELKTGDLVRHRGIVKEVEIANDNNNQFLIWGAVKFFGDQDFYFTHKGGIEKYKFDF